MESKTKIKVQEYPKVAIESAAGSSRRGIWLGVLWADLLLFLSCSQNMTLSSFVCPPQWDKSALPDIGFKVCLSKSPMGRANCVLY